MSSLPEPAGPSYEKKTILMWQNIVGLDCYVISLNKFIFEELPTCKATLYLFWTFPILYNKMAADKNNNTRRKVVANNNKLCLGIVATLLPAGGAPQSVNNFGSLPPKINKQHFVRRQHNRQKKYNLPSITLLLLTSQCLKVVFLKQVASMSGIGDSLPLSPSRVSELSVSECVILS